MILTKILIFELRNETIEWAISKATKVIQSSG